MIILVFAPADSRVFFVKYWNLFNPSFITLFLAGSQGESDQVKWYKRYMKMYRTFHFHFHAFIVYTKASVSLITSYIFNIFKYENILSHIPILNIQLS